MRLKARTFLLAALLLCYGGAARARDAAQDTQWDKANDEGEVAFARGDYEKAERKHLEALKHAERIGAKSPQRAGTLTKLAAVYERQQKFDEAEGAYRRAVEAAEAMVAAKDSEFAMFAPDMLASCLERLADFLCERRKFSDAEATYLRALDVLTHIAVKKEETPKTQDEWIGFLVKATAGGAQVRLAGVSDKLATLYLVQNKFAEAEPVFKLSIATWERIERVREHPKLAVTLENLGVLYARQGRFAEAEPHFQRALQIYEETLGAEHVQVAKTLETFAMLLGKLGREAEASAALERARAIRGKTR
ncbi:MAG TPA: tetratricopeptide repeat protein [Pyrinomonadaceae bacterium]|nr:tetratricopeptide repeat protein [Pyrinomonadaceae bacterium]